MQEPIRYYITKRGEVAQSAPEDEDRVVPNADLAAESKAPKRSAPAPAKAVERLVKGAIRGRSAQR